MFYDDVKLVAEMIAKYGPAPQPIVDVGGLSRPCVADYQRTIDAVAKLRDLYPDYSTEAMRDPGMRAAQMARYLDIERPLETSCPGYRIENPETGGLPLERLSEKYDPAAGTGIGTATLLSVLEHVDDPFEAISALRDAMTPGGIAIVSVPFIFPEHEGGGQDCWRFTPTALKHIFSLPKGSEEPPRWQLLETSWRLRIPATAGVLNMKTGEPQIIESCYAAARAA